MPTLVLKTAPLQNPERYGQLASALTDLTVQLLGKRREVTAVVIDDLPAARWHVGGAPLKQPTALLEISITQGTNTPVEKAAFIEGRASRRVQQARAWRSWTERCRLLHARVSGRCAAKTLRRLAADFGQQLLFALAQTQPACIVLSCLHLGAQHVHGAR